MPPNKALQLTSHSVLESPSGRVWSRNLGASNEPRRRCGSQLSVDPLDGDAIRKVRVSGVWDAHWTMPLRWRSLHDQPPTSPHVSLSLQHVSPQ
jgi:hypothetical protein